MFRHPKYYKELRKRNKLDQVISPRAETSGTGVHPDPGPKPQAASAKRQASSVKPQASEDTSDKHQAPSSKRQA